jgi:hypothetical protein
VADHSITFNLIAYAPTDGVVFKDRDSGCLGVKSIEIASNSMYMAVLTFDEKLKVYNTLSWRLVATIDFKLGENTQVFVEADDQTKAPMHGSLPKKCTGLLT